MDKAGSTLHWAKRANRNAYFHYSDLIIEVDPEYFYSLRTPRTIATQSYKITNNCVEKNTQR